MVNPQDDVQWLVDRLGVLTASKDFKTCVAGYKDGKESLVLTKAAELIVGPEQVYAALEGDKRSIPSIDWGNTHEDRARAWYELQTGNVVELVGLQLHPKHRLVGCSPDGLVGDNGGVETKCPETIREHMRHLVSDAPADYYYQIQGNLWVTGREWWDFVSYHPLFPAHLKLHGYV